MAVRHPTDHEHEHETHAHGDRAVVQRSSYWERFGIAQGIAIAMGIFFVVTGAIGLARAGLDSLTSPSVEVWGMGMTPALALAHLIVGVVALLGGASRAAGRSAGMILGATLIAAGIIALAQPVDSLGWNDTNGVAYLIAGAVAMAAAILTPVAAMEERVTTH